MNPIENVWELMKGKVTKDVFTNKAENNLSVELSSTNIEHSKILPTQYAA